MKSAVISIVISLLLLFIICNNNNVNALEEDTKFLPWLLVATGLVRSSTPSRQEIIDDTNKRFKQHLQKIKVTIEYGRKLLRCGAFKDSAKVFTDVRCLYELLDPLEHTKKSDMDVMGDEVHALKGPAATLIKQAQHFYSQHGSQCEANLKDKEQQKYRSLLEQILEDEYGGFLAKDGKDVQLPYKLVFDKKRVPNVATKTKDYYSQLIKYNHKCKSDRDCMSNVCIEGKCQLCGASNKQHRDKWFVTAAKEAEEVNAKRKSNEILCLPCINKKQQSGRSSAFCLDTGECTFYNVVEGVTGGRLRSTPCKTKWIISKDACVSSTSSLAQETTKKSLKTAIKHGKKVDKNDFLAMTKAQLIEKIEELQSKCLRSNLVPPSAHSSQKR